jgi:hypothetical protein
LTGGGGLAAGKRVERSKVGGVHVAVHAAAAAAAECDGRDLVHALGPVLKGAALVLHCVDGELCGCGRTKASAGSRRVLRVPIRRAAQRCCCRSLHMHVGLAAHLAAAALAAAAWEAVAPGLHQAPGTASQDAHGLAHYRCDVWHRHLARSSGGLRAAAAAGRPSSKRSHAGAAPPRPAAG